MLGLLLITVSRPFKAKITLATEMPVEYAGVLIVMDLEMRR